MSDLFAKYDVPAPRYTSYPTVPFWSDMPTTKEWLNELAKAFDDQSATWSLYFHLPFCESLCTFCACNTVITRDHGREEGYVDLLSSEWNLYRERVPGLLERPLLGVHLGQLRGTLDAARARALVDDRRAERQVVLVRWRALDSWYTPH